MMSKFKNSQIKSRTLIIRDLSMYFERSTLDKYEDITFATPFKRLCFVERILRKMLSICNIFLPYFYGEWKKELNKYDTIILFAGTKIKDPIAKHINNSLNNNIKIRLIYWYWNPVSISTPPCYIKLQASKFKLWTFDYKDSIRYEINFNTTFYSKYVSLNEQEKVYDVYFVGMNKGRLNLINKLKYEFSTFNIKLYAYIIDENGKRYKKPYLSPKENIINISKSKAILDITQKGQSGLTLRVMEAIFLKRKLITNDKSIVNQPFYAKQNIFILDYDKLDDLRFFLSSPLKPISSELIIEYDIENWVKRFQIDNFLEKHK